MFISSHRIMNIHHVYSSCNIPFLWGNRCRYPVILLRDVNAVIYSYSARLFESVIPRVTWLCTTNHVRRASWRCVHCFFVCRLWEISVESTSRKEIGLSTFDCEYGLIEALCAADMWNSAPLMDATSHWSSPFRTLALRTQRIQCKCNGSLPDANVNDIYIYIYIYNYHACIVGLYGEQA